MSGSKLQKKKPEEVTEDWLVTYADAITLLMSFFILIASISRIDLNVFEKVQAGISRDLLQKEVVQPLTLLEIDIEDVLFTYSAETFADVSVDDKGIVIELQANALFPSGSAQLKNDALPMLQKFAETFGSPRYEYYVIEIEGHTDDVPINTPLFPSNWELSAARATNVVRFFISRGIAATRLRAIGFAETQPKLPNREADGKAIPENQAANRRVAIRVHR